MTMNLDYTTLIKYIEKTAKELPETASLETPFGETVDVSFGNDEHQLILESIVDILEVNQKKTFKQICINKAIEMKVSK